MFPEPPDFPRNLRVTEQTGQSLVITWNAPGTSTSAGATTPAADSPVTGYILQYKETRGKEFSCRPTVS